MNILAADDDKISRMLLRRMLEADGRHAVSVASDGEEAWWMLKDTNNRYDAVVLDVMMPRIDAETHRALVDALLNEIHDWLTATKVVAVSKRFDRMALRANGLKGGCANLGLHALGRLLDAVETMLSAEADSELRSHFVLAEAELAPLLDQVAVCTASIRQLQLSPG